jgi:uncharacterized membrane protein (UPF0136 family)
MTEQDDLQDLWQSQDLLTTHDDVPTFGLLDELTAPVEFPASGDSKRASAGVFLYPVYVALRELPRATSSWETAAYVLSILASIGGVWGVLLRRSNPINADQERSVEEFRGDLAREYHRQRRSFQMPFAIALTVTWASLMASEVMRSIRQQSPTVGIFFLPIFVAVMAFVLIRRERSIDERAVRRIYRGY